MGGRRNRPMKHQDETFFNIKEVDGKNAGVRSEEGADIPYDLLVTIPPHKGMEVIEKNGLGQNGWIPTNQTKLQHGRPQQRIRARRHHQHSDQQGGLDRAFRSRDAGREHGRASSRWACRCANTTARCSASSKRARTARPTRCSITRTRPIRRRRTGRCTGSRWPTTNCIGPPPEELL